MKVFLRLKSHDRRHVLIDRGFLTLAEIKRQASNYFNVQVSGLEVNGAPVDCNSQMLLSSIIDYNEANKLLVYVKIYNKSTRDQANGSLEPAVKRKKIAAYPRSSEEVYNRFLETVKSALSEKGFQEIKETSKLPIKRSYKWAIVEYEKELISMHRFTLFIEERHDVVLKADVFVIRVVSQSLPVREFKYEKRCFDWENAEIYMINTLALAILDDLQNELHLHYYSTFKNIPWDVLKIIIRKLDVRSCVKLSTTSKYFSEMCNRDELWRFFYRRDYDEMAQKPEHYTWLRCYKSVVRVT